LVRSGVCRRVRPRVALRFSPGRLALRPRRGDLVDRGGPAVAPADPGRRFGIVVPRRSSAILSGLLRTSCAAGREHFLDEGSSRRRKARGRAPTLGSACPRRRAAFARGDSGDRRGVRSKSDLDAGGRGGNLRRSRAHPVCDDAGPLPRLERGLPPVPTAPARFSRARAAPARPVERVSSPRRPGRYAA